MMALTLYTLADSYDTLRQLAADPEAESGAWDQALADLQDEATHKIAAIGLLITEWRVEREVINEEIARLKARSDNRTNAITRLHDYLLDEMPRVGLKKVDDPRITVWVQNNPPAVDITDPVAVPVDFKRGTLTLDYEEWPDELRAKVPAWGFDRKAILDVLKGGLDVPGAQISQGQHVRVR